MPVFDPFINPIKETLKETIKPSNVRTHLYDYILNRLGVGPTTERFGVPTPTKPYIGIDGKPVTGNYGGPVSSNYVGMDTSPGNVGRNIDLEAIQTEINNPYVGIDPSTQQVIEKGGKNYVIGKDQKVVGQTVLDEDAPTGLGRWWAGTKDLFTGNKYDYDKRGKYGTQDDQLLKDTETTRKKTAADRAIDQEKLRTAIDHNRLLNQESTLRNIDQANEAMYDAKHRRNLDLINRVAENQLAIDLNYLKQAYPLQQAAAWDATKRGIYGDKYSASAAQRRMGESAGAEAQMLAGIASQANAAANMRGRYSGKNISIG